MKKYELEINEAIEKYNWKGMVEFFSWGDDTTNVAILKSVYLDFRRSLSSNARRALELYYDYNEEGIFKKEDMFIPVMEMPCASTVTLPSASGLYFLGMMGVNPEGKEYYLVKIGSSYNIKARVAQYACYNPMIYIGGYLECSINDRIQKETRCHNYLAEQAIAVAQNAREWFYVDEKIYYELCDTFADKEMFKAIAENRD